MCHILQTQYNSRCLRLVKLWGAAIFDLKALKTIITITCTSILKVSRKEPRYSSLKSTINTYKEIFSHIAKDDITMEIKYN